MKKKRFLFSLLMAIVMMAMSPQRMWADSCGTCSGSGKVSCGCNAGFVDVDCSTCGGSGMVTVTSSDGENETQVIESCVSCTAGKVQETCSTCNGSGYVPCSSCNGSGKIAHSDPLTEHSAVAATCTTAGNSACWFCSACGKYFSDAEGNNEIAASSVVIPATGHKYTVSGSTATCTVCGATAPAYTLDKALLNTELTSINTACTSNSTTFTLTFAYSAPAGATQGAALNEDNSIYLYKNTADGSDYTVAPATSGAVIMAPEICTGMFTKLTNLTSITFTNFDTENVTMMNIMFQRCSQLQSLDLSGFYTDGVTTMNTMFMGCSQLTSIDLSSFNTSSVSERGMRGMFDRCPQLQSLTIGNFDMSYVTDISNMFGSCDNLNTLTLKALPHLADGSFNTQFTGTGKTVNYVLDDNSVVDTEDYLPAATTAPKYTRSMTSQWETLVLPFAISVAGTEDYKVFAATAVGTCPQAPLTGTIAAGTPVLLHLNDGVQMPYALTLTASSNAVSTGLTTAATSVSGLKLTGSYAQTGLNSTAGYVLENGQFVKIANATNKAVSPFRAYVAGTGSADTYKISEHNFTIETPTDTYQKSAATCTDDAIYYHKCANCDASSEGNTNSTWTKTGSAGHSFTNYTYNNDVTCAKNGTMTASCDNGCGATDTKDDPEHPATGNHNFVNGANCTVCGTAAPVYTLDKASLNTALGNISYNFTLTFAYSAPASAIEVDALNSGNTIYLYKNTADGTDYTVAPTTSGAVIKAPADCSLMIYNLLKLTSLTFTNFNTSSVTDMKAMLAFNSALSNLSFGSNFNTASVTTMKQMFLGCESLTSLDLSNFNTSNVKDMSSMFKECSQLQSLTIGNFGMGNVETIYDMFTDCTNLNTLTLKALPYLANSTFNTQFTGTDKTVNYELDDNSVVYTGTNYLPAADIWAVYKRTNIKNKWGTLVVPFDVLADQEEYDLYSIISVEDEKLTLKRPEGILPAGTPVLIRMSEAGKDAETGKYILFLEAANTTLKTTITNPAAVDGYTLKGSYDVAEVGNNDYIISNNAFWKASGLKENDNLWKDKDGNTMASDERHVYCSPFRAYLASSTSNNAKMLSIGWNDDEDITAVETLDALTSDEAQYYDINGRKLNDLQQGINIVKRGNKTYKIIVK